MNPFKSRPYVRMTECPNCRAVTVCRMLSQAYGRTIWECDEGHVFDDRV